MTTEPERPAPADVVEFIERAVGVDLEPWQRSFTEAQFAHARRIDNVARSTLAAIVPGVAAAAEKLGRAFAELANSLPALAALDEIAARDDRFARALELTRTRNTGPARQPRPPRTINARGTRP
ncbi:hypothetical protein [Amycolatopsis sp. NPDC102389]|uniref:hypothetical protein n=1 Tax=Amycolatopsis sp. NPDC102389 TaxID=3363941 RepID=UPI0037F26647